MVVGYGWGVVFDCAYVLGCFLFYVKHFKEINV